MKAVRLFLFYFLISFCLKISFKLQNLFEGNYCDSFDCIHINGGDELFE